MQDVEKVVYFASYVVLDVDDKLREKYLKELEEEFKEKVSKIEDEKTIDEVKSIFNKIKKQIETLRPKVVIDEILHNKFNKRFPGLYRAGIGTEAILELIKEIDLKKLENDLTEQIVNGPASERKGLEKRLTLVRMMLKSGVKQGCTMSLIIFHQLFKS